MMRCLFSKTTPPFAHQLGAWRFAGLRQRYQGNIHLRCTALIDACLRVSDFVTGNDNDALTEPAGHVLIERKASVCGRNTV